MISGQDWDDPNTWWGLDIVIVVFGFAVYAVFF